MFSRVAGAISGADAESTSGDEGVSLNSVLGTPDLRVELGLLVLLCIDAMRNDLTATFISTSADSPQTGQHPRQPAPGVTVKPGRDLISFDQADDAKDPLTSSYGRNTGQIVDSTHTQALQRSSHTYFDKWRGSVMYRICDVLCVRGETVRQAKARRKQRMDDATRHNQNIASLIDFGEEDPFVATPYTANRKQGHYEVIKTRILALEKNKRVVVLHCLLLLLLSLESYTAHSRVLMLRLASSLELETDILVEHEASIAQGLLATAASQMDAEETAKRQASNGAAARRWKVGLAAVGGAVLIGVTGGLAAPLLAAGLGTVMGGLGLGVVSTYLGALAGSSVLVGSLFGAYGAKMTGKLMEQYAREVEDFEFVPVQDPSRPWTQRENEWTDEQDVRDPTKRERHRLRVTIGISGWLSSPSDVSRPWEVIDSAATESFALRFELDAMLRLGNSLEDVLFSYAWDGFTYTIVSRTLLGALYAGLWPLGLIKAASVLDNPFSVALARADKAGKVLAHALIDGVQGKRPVALIGYSVGARVIYSCLLELAEQHAFGLVESAILMGTPAASEHDHWRLMRSVVSGRMINVYSTEDYVLGFLYRSTKLQMGVAGLQEIRDAPGVENMDMSKHISGHDQYRFMVGKILVSCGMGDVNLMKFSEQERALEAAEKKKQQIKKRTKEEQEAKTETQRNANASKQAPETSHKPKFVLLSKAKRQTDMQITTVSQSPTANVSSDVQTSEAIKDQSSCSSHVLTSNSDLLDLTGLSINHNEPAADAIAVQNSTMRLTKSGSDVSVTEVLVVKGNSGGESDKSDGEGDDYAQHWDVDQDAYEVASDFGDDELAMVEPEPMDDNDFGLM